MPTHGSLTKAGKVRAQTPKVDSTTDNTSRGPLRKNKSLYIKRVVAQSDSRYNSRRRRR
ncbi:30S ribosomal protein S30e [Candidatus Bathyarchaeota archaeon]|nr:30S ribosomal protein S30e [archaeon]RLI03136.1 MAG: 30S ribosomal protein S30e [Candidatus Bathyarchaeota archaeon]